MMNAGSAQTDMKGRQPPGFLRSRTQRSSWLTLLGSVSFHAAVFALAAHFVTGSGGGDAEPAASEGGEDLSLSVKVVAQPTVRTTPASTIRRALPARQQRLMVAAHTAFSLPPPQPQADLPEARLPEPEPAQRENVASPDTPPARKVAGQAGKKRGGGSPGAKGSSGAGTGSGHASAPRPISTRIPVYPYAAKKRGEQGLVLVRVRVNESGKVESSTLYRSSGHPDLDQAAVACVWKWSFAPGQSGGRPVESSAVVRVAFRLES